MMASEFGDYIRNLRKERKMGVRELERRSGISQAYISQIETGKRDTPKPIMINKLSKGLDVSYIELMIKAKYVMEADILEYCEVLKND